MGKTLDQAYILDLHGSEFPSPPPSYEKKKRQFANMITFNKNVKKYSKEK